jgi:uncharacterized protein YndB with AHSA1/START domain
MLEPLRNSATASLTRKRSDTSDRELIISRLFDAPRELLFDIWSDPKQIAEWWGPTGFTTTTQKFEFHVGGEWKHIMRGPDGTEYPSESVFLEIVRPERIVRTHGGGKKGEPPSVSAQMTVTFAVEGGKTRVTIHHVFPTVEMREFVVREHNAEEGARQTLARLAEYVAKPEVACDYELHISRVFDAPRELVYKAFTDTEMLAQWIGPRGFQAQDLGQDLRVGGKWRLCLHSDGFDTGDGELKVLDLWQGGVFREIEAPERIVYTFAWEDRGSVGLDGGPHETVITVTFRELGEKTAMTFRQAFFTSVGERDGHNKGWNSSFDRFGDLVQGLQTQGRY